VGLKSIRNLDYTVLACADLARTRDFYRDVMHFAIDVERENWVQFRVGGVILALRPQLETDDSSAPYTNLQLAFRVPPAEIDACHAELIAAGVPIARGPARPAVLAAPGALLPRSRGHTARDLRRVLTSNRLLRLLPGNGAPLTDQTITDSGDNNGPQWRDPGLSMRTDR
jgi:glyoxylase I family protein